MADPLPQQFRLIRSIKSNKERYKLLEGGFVSDRQEIIGDTQLTGSVRGEDYVRPEFTPMVWQL